MSDRYVEPMTALEWREFIDIMMVAQYGRPPLAQERRLRELLAVRQPEATTMPWDLLVTLAMNVVGHYFMLMFRDGAPLVPATASAS